MIELENEIVVVAYAVDVKLLGRKAKTGLEAVDGGQVCKDDRVIKRILTAPLSFIVGEVESAIFLDGAAQGNPNWFCRSLFRPGAARMLFASMASLRKYS